MFDWFPKNVSTFGGEIDSVFWLIFYIVGIWFVLTEALIIYFVIRYRRRKGRRASFIDGETWKQAAWILIPAGIVLILDLGIDFAGARVYHLIKGEIPEGEHVVRITASQFNWAMTYPGADGRFDTDDDLSIDNELHVPVDEVIRLALRSDDVIHSFFVPVLRLKQDVVPGREIEAWFEVTEPGEYEIACAELCGFGHYTMRGILVAHTAEDFARWVTEQ